MSSFHSRACIAGLPLLLGPALLCLWMPTAYAQNASDGFDYTPGVSLSGQNGGSGWKGAWDGTGATVLADKGTPFLNKLVIGGYSVGVYADPNQFLTTDRATDFLFGKPETTEWFSFMITRITYNKAAVNPPAYGGISLGGSQGLFIGDTGNGRWGMDNAGKSLQGVVSASEVTDGAPTFLVVQAEFRNRADKFTLYENPTPGLAAPDVPGVRKLDLDVPATSQVQLVYGNGNAYVIDELRLGGSYPDVAPGPPGSALPPPAAPEAASAAETADSTQTIEAAYAARSAALGRKDVEAVLATQSENYVMMDTAGKSSPQPGPVARKALAALFRENATVKEETTLDDVTLGDSGSDATVTVHDRLVLHPKSGPGAEIVSVFHDYWVSEDSVWHLARRRVVSTHRTKTPGPSAAPAKKSRKKTP